MARSTLRALLTIAGLITASPALAQFPNIFDSLFGNPPQRPPADVPSRPPSQSFPSQPQYVPPTEERYQPRPWQKPHRPNLTGTPGAHRPTGSTLAQGRRPKATGDYKAWNPGR